MEYKEKEIIRRATCMRKTHSEKVICDVCKKTIPTYSASAELRNKEMKIDFQVEMPRLDKTGEYLDLCPVCLRKAIDTAKIVIYASDAAWKKFGSPREK